FHLGLDGPLPRPGSSEGLLTPQALATTAAALWRGHRYRRLLVVVEACEGGVLGTRLTAPGAALLSAASPTENSHAAEYDFTRGVWLADDFALALWQAQSRNPDWSLARAYERVYHHVPGSHVSLYAPAFGDLHTVTLDEFQRP